MMQCYTKDGLREICGKILILGDSISDIGDYVSFLNGYLAITENTQITIINGGVSSETCSGLSEPEHPFPRPCVLGRIDAALQKVKPDWVILSYGVNDGIYYPFEEGRFAAYKNGMTALIQKVQQCGARAVVLTPLCFDAAADGVVTGGDDEQEYSYRKPHYQYDTVLERYAQWIMTEGAQLADVAIDIRTPFREDLAVMRRQTPAYASGDGIHPSRHGHYVIAHTLLYKLFGVQTECLEELLNGDNGALFELLYQRDRLSHSYYKEWIGHDNPYKNELPADWQAQVAALDRQIAARLQAQPLTRQFQWNGFAAQEFFSTDGYEVIVAKPKQAAEGRPWVWRTEFFGAFPSADLELLRRGWHVAQLKIPDLYGCPYAVQCMERFRVQLQQQFLLAEKPVLFGFSRGGLYAVNYAAAYPQQVQLLYLDAPVVDTASWPGGKFSGEGSPAEWAQCQAAYGAAYDSTAQKQQNAQKLLRARLPLLLCAGDSDRVVPYSENGAFLAECYQNSGVPFRLVVKPGVGHHPHSLEDPSELVEFILKHAAKA